MFSPAVRKAERRKLIWSRLNETEPKMSDLPIACSLTTPELQQRRSTILLNVRTAALELKELEDGFAYRFPSENTLLADLLTLIQLEHQCCPFLRFNLIIEAGNGPVWLELTGPAGAKEFLVDNFN